MWIVHESHGSDLEMRKIVGHPRGHITDDDRVKNKKRRQKKKKKNKAP
ncbi:hypothetical protein QG37_05865 [Candidozyma auris]|uniref:Uncharacterized protein n=1 Tax=Candidozyma auris TaxID=498019 RepID=A0A0L0NU01_CANAR|nr:hypothetical protein QG37_05865 [[Candida] auris]